MSGEIDTKVMYRKRRTAKPSHFNRSISLDYKLPNVPFQAQRSGSPQPLNTQVVSGQAGAGNSGGAGNGGGTTHMSYSNLNSFSHQDFSMTTDLSLGTLNSIQQVINNIHTQS